MNHAKAFSGRCRQNPWLNWMSWRSRGWPSIWRTCAIGAGVYSFSASAAARPIARMPLTTFAKSPRLRLMPQPTTFPSLPRGPMTKGGRPFLSSGCEVSKLCAKDMLFILSVGGGDLEKNISPNLVRALQYAKEIGATIGGICGRNGGYTAKVADVCVLVPTVNAATVTPHAEAFQSVIWHLLVSHPALKANETKWESASAAQRRHSCQGKRKKRKKRGGFSLFPLTCCL